MFPKLLVATNISLDINTWVAVCSFALALVISCLNALLWYSGSEKKKYAAERDFNHLKNNQLQMSQGLDMILKTIDQRSDVIERDIHEIRITLNLEGRRKDKHTDG